MVAVASAYRVWRLKMDAYTRAAPSCRVMSSTCPILTPATCTGDPASRPEAFSKSITTV